MNIIMIELIALVILISQRLFTDYIIDENENIEFKPLLICVEPLSKYHLPICYHCIFLGLLAASGTSVALLGCVPDHSVVIAAPIITHHHHLVSSLGQHPSCVNFHLNPD